MDLFVANKTIILFLVIGLVAGLVAQFAIPGKGYGLVATALIGIGGNVLGTLFLSKFITFVEKGVARDIVAAIIGAIIVQLAFNLIRAQFPQKDRAR